MNIEFLNKLKEDIINRASNNNENQAYIIPSAYGFSTTSEGSQECLSVILSFENVRSAKIDGKNHISVYLY